MKHLIVGAGATLAEALALGIPRVQCPPVMTDFARKMWWNYSPYPLLDAYLRNQGYTNLGEDPRDLFFRLEESGKENIERFMEFAWNNRSLDLAPYKSNLPPGFISGFRITTADPSSKSQPTQENFWQNMLYHGIGSPLSFFMDQCFFENGKGWKDFSQAKTISSRLTPNDLVINLNFDTVFELALQQMGRDVCYVPNIQSPHEILVAKPHGSLNLIMNHEGFMFGQPEWLGMPQHPGYDSYSGLVPPRLNKNYAQHPFAELIIKLIRDRTPQKIIMWGVGLTQSDTDLLSLYQGWAKSADSIDVINPDQNVAANVHDLLKCDVKHYRNLTEWGSEN
ncbi:MAG: hypothetical protein JO269_01775 [Burkholderiaceae bacterium]|nr:hypothetical protein [Burkholderiaceae bacterium]